MTAERRLTPALALLAALALAAMGLIVSRSGAAAAVNVSGLRLGQVQADATGGTLWIANEDYGHGTTLYAVDGASGTIRAQLALGRVAVGQVLYAEGWLWVTVQAETGGGTPAPALLRLEPDTLAVLSRTPLRSLATAATLAAAAGSLWVGDGGTLDQVATIGGQIIHRVTLPGVHATVLGTGEPDDLLVSAADERGIWRLERRDATTGALLAVSARYPGAGERLGGVVAGRLWISQAGGMMGSISQLDARTLRPRRAVVPTGQTTNAIRARVIAGVLYVSGGTRSAVGDYCADPVSGRRRATLPRAVHDGWLLTGDAHRLYVASNGLVSRLERVPIPPACR